METSIKPVNNQGSDQLKVAPESGAQRVLWHSSTQPLSKGSAALSTPPLPPSPAPFQPEPAHRLGQKHIYSRKHQLYFILFIYNWIKLKVFDKQQTFCAILTAFSMISASSGVISQYSLAGFCKLWVLMVSLL